jgi:hypothetical protein
LHLNFTGREEAMKRAVAERGQGRKPYGFYEGEQAVIERMRALQAAGLGYDRIAAQLNEDKVKPRSGDRWWGRTINNIPGASSTVETMQSTADRMLEEMRKIEPAWMAPVSIRALRAAMGVESGEFDRAVLALRDERRVYLSQHDFPQGERPEARRLLVRDGDRYFVAITALRAQ